MSGGSKRAFTCATKAPGISVYAARRKLYDGGLSSYIHSTQYRREVRRRATIEHDQHGVCYPTSRWCPGNRRYRRWMLAVALRAPGAVIAVPRSRTKRKLNGKRVYVSGRVSPPSATARNVLCCNSAADEQTHPHPTIAHGKHRTPPPPQLVTRSLGQRKFGISLLRPGRRGVRSTDYGMRIHDYPPLPAREPANCRATTTVLGRGGEGKASSFKSCR